MAAWASSAACRSSASTARSARCASMKARPRSRSSSSRARCWRRRTDERDLISRGRVLPGPGGAEPRPCNQRILLAMKLLEPLRINGMTIPNRVIVPAMVTRLSGEDGYVNAAVIDRYVRYAEGHVGLIVVEATAIHGNKSGPLLRLSDNSFIAGHRALVDRVHAASDSKIVPQIIHFLKVARSGWRQTIDSLSTQEVDGIIALFADAAAR